MTRMMCRLSLLVALASGLILLPHGSATAADPQPQPTQMASVEQLKLDAFNALKTGHFDQSNELLAKAASISQDPTVQQMAGWIKQFETQRQEFAAERHKQYE